jgi:hypothetical protein
MPRLKIKTPPLAKISLYLSHGNLSLSRVPTPTQPEWTEFYLSYVMDRARARAYFSIHSEGGVNAVIGALALNPTCLYFEILKKNVTKKICFCLHLWWSSCIIFYRCKHIGNFKPCM